MPCDDAKRKAETLNAATRAGDLAGAYRVVAGLPKPDAMEVLLTAGHSSLFTNDKHFVAYMQAAIAGASRGRLDGWAYNASQKAR